MQITKPKPNEWTTIWKPNYSASIIITIETVTNTKLLNPTKLLQKTYHEKRILINEIIQ